MKELYHSREVRYLTGLESPFFKRHFWWPFKKKKKDGETAKRPGAMPPAQVKKTIESFGEGKIVEIMRIGYDGQIDDMPLMIEITGIYPDGFVGRIVNLEREMLEKGTDKLVYAKKGGGTIEFQYADGDIKEIKESEDEKIITEERNVPALKEILAALEKGDNVFLAYYESTRRGSVSAEGIITDKSDDNSRFKISIEKINHIPLEKKVEKEFDVDKDLVIDIELA